MLPASWEAGEQPDAAAAEVNAAAPAAAAALAIGLALALYAAVLRRIGGDALPWYALTIALAVAYILLTILPPSGGIFDPRTVATSGAIPF